jgi:hypothetical protein
MPVAAPNVAIKRFVASAMAAVALLAAMIIAAPSARAGDGVWGVHVQVSPNWQPRAAGEKARWYVVVDSSIAKVSVRFGDGKSAAYYTANHPLLNYYVRHAFYPGCTTHAPHTYTQRWTVYHGGAYHSKTTQVTVRYSGPLCV